MAGGTGASGISFMLRVRFVIEDFIEKVIRPKRRAMSKAVAAVYSDEQANQLAQRFVLSAIEHLSAISHQIEDRAETVQVDKKTFEVLLALDHLASDLCDKIVGPEEKR